MIRTDGIGSRWGWLWVVIAMSGLLYLHFTDFFQYGNSRFVEPWGDGYKTYHAFLYHTWHDTTYHHFAGMNYPYGEHVVPGDTEPAISNSIKWFKARGIDVSDYALGILNGSLLVSLLLCSLFLYLLFRQLQLPAWYAAIAAIGLTFLAPQLHRMSSHYGLARPEVIPLILYGLLRLEQTRHYGYSIMIAIVTVIYSAIHFYFFALIAFTVTGYMFFRLLYLRNWRAWPTYLVHYTIQILTPLLFFYYWMMHNDPVTDRTAAPWGFFHYRSYRSGLLTSPFEPHWRWFSEHIYPIEGLDFEARSYLGLVAIIGLVAMLIWVLIRRYRGPAFTVADHHRFLGLQLATGGAILILAFGIPFTWEGWEHWLDYTGPLRQFRSIGRFAWVLFYAANIAVFAWLYYRLRAWAYLLVIPLAILLFESYHYTTSKDLRLDVIEEQQPGRRYTDIPGLDLTAHQAILPIPYFNLGSDQFWWDVSGFIGQKSMTMSMQTGLPLTAAMLTRSSRSQTLRQLQLVTEPYRLPAILADLPSEKPMLMMWDTIRIKEYGGKFDHLRRGARMIYRDRELEMFTLPLASFSDRIEDRVDRIYQKIVQADSSMFSRSDCWPSDPSAQWYYKDFDAQTSDLPYWGSGGLQGQMQELTTLYDGEWPAADTTQHLLSVWMYIDKDLYSRTEVKVEAYVPATGEVVAAFSEQVRKLIRVFDSNGWAMLEFPFSVDRSGTRLRWTMQQSRLGEQPLYLDELFIRPHTLDLYCTRPGYVWMNNRHFPLPSRVNK